MNSADAAKPTIQPFDPKRHDWEGFSCGVEQVDAFFKCTANKLAKTGNRVSLILIRDENNKPLYVENISGLSDLSELKKRAFDALTSIETERV